MSSAHNLNPAETTAALREWYRGAARDLPWRVPPGSNRVPDPYHVWLSEVMLQQTTVAAVRGYFRRFLLRWPDVAALAAADDADVMGAWAGLGYYARARNLLKCAREVTAQGGFPTDEAGLRALPGIGPYTAAAVASIAFGARAVVMDGNVERVMARLFAVETPLPDAKPLLYAHADRLTPDAGAGDHAQAVMDLGATICTPKKPACGICPVHSWCAGRLQAAALPRKRPKPPKPIRVGHVFMARRADGALWLEQRPQKGLLGGMLGFPGSDWCEDPVGFAPPFAAPWQEAGEVRHSFTHFHLRLAVHAASVPMDAPGDYIAAAHFCDSALPTVMRKVFRAGHAALAPA